MVRVRVIISGGEDPQISFELLKVKNFSSVVNLSSLISSANDLDRKEKEEEFAAEF